MKRILGSLGLAVVLTILLASCMPNALNDHPYRHMPTGPIGSTGGG